MKYFTSELLARCRSTDDDVADAAAMEWETASTDYRKRLRAIRSHLPVGARRLLSRVNLHDAEVLTGTYGKEHPSFTLTVRLDGDASTPGDVLELRYLVVAGKGGGISAKKYVPAPDASEGRWILYDEFDTVKGHFTHKLLLSGGYEVEIRFRNLDISGLKEAPASPFKFPAEAVTWPLVSA